MPHIQIPDIPPFTAYRANGTQSVFIYPFPIFATEDLYVRLNGALQQSGYSVTDAGLTTGGSVHFDTPPADGVIVTLERRLPLERLSDFIEGGDFAANAINTELDYIVASLQQLERDQSKMLRLNDLDDSGLSGVLPPRSTRAGKVLGFDGEGHLSLYNVGESAAPDTVTATGTGAVTRSVVDKLRDVTSVKDFGAVGDGLNDDTIAFQNALAAHSTVYVPPGRYLITQSLSLRARQTLIGSGQSSEIDCSNSSIAVIDIPTGYTSLCAVRIRGGQIGVRLRGVSGPCVHNTLSDLTLWGQSVGLVLDGYTDPSKPCYWNQIDRVLIAQPTLHGVHMIRSGAGDTPNANRFTKLRVYSLGAQTTGSGIYVQEGSFNNSFTDCEMNVAPTASACVRVGAGSNKTLFVNLYTESSNGVPNIQLDAGSIETSILNLLSASDGAAIYDLSGGEYTAINAGFPYKNSFKRSFFSDATVKRLRYETRYTDTSGTLDLDASISVHLLSSFGGALTARLPLAADVPGSTLTIKKIDTSKNVIAITEINGHGPDGRAHYLGSEHDYVALLSNGAEWLITAASRSASNTRFFDGSGLYDIDMAVDTYLISAFGGALTARLPPADAPQAIGRTVTIKKTDPSANSVTVSEQGGPGPDQFHQPLSAQYQAITVISDGGQWFILSRYP